MALIVKGNITFDLNDYQCSEEGVWLPLVNEFTWPIPARVALYFVGLTWSLLGVIIISDNYMCAIERIVSRTRTIKVASQESENGYEEIEVKVWNDEVANLTLITLGCSAAELLLAFIEMVENNLQPGELGPSTLVGSAAFNLFVIMGMCVVVVPSPDVRIIKSVKVFAVTAFFCIFAYVWLLIILVVITPNCIDLWEAIVTLLFYPIFVSVTYIVDKDYCSRKKEYEAEDMELGFEEKKPLFAADGSINDKNMRNFIKELRVAHHELTEEEVARLAAARMQEDQSHGHLWYRINATRRIGGSDKLTPSMSQQLHEIYESLQDHQADATRDDHTFTPSTVDMSNGGSKTVIEFTATRASVLENEGRIRVGIRRYGKMNIRSLVRFETIDGTAESQLDYIPVKDTIIFEKDETYKYVDIEIIDDNEWEPDEVFFAKLSIDPSDPANTNSIIGKRAIMEITIINDDEPGTFEFAKPSLLFKESAGKALVPIDRCNGADGRVTVTWKTSDMTAVSGKEYEGGEGTLVFEHGETTKMLEITIYDDQEFEKDISFKIEILQVDDGASIGRIKKTIVTIVNDEDFNNMVSRLVLMSNMNMDALRVETTTYQDQFRNAMNVNGGDIDGATHMDYIMHFLTFGFKIIFALVPPPSIWGGWLAFVIASILIGVMIAIVRDLATIFSCLTGLMFTGMHPFTSILDNITGTTLLALGTNIADIFSHKYAAKQQKTADGSIGNIIGSNAVNIFLGLGLPWTIAAIYWTAKGKALLLDAGALSFSVVCYTIGAIVVIASLFIRRRFAIFGKAELGGPFVTKLVTCLFFIAIWLLYVTLSVLHTLDIIRAEF